MPRYSSSMKAMCAYAPRTLPLVTHRSQGMTLLHFTWTRASKDPRATPIITQTSTQRGMG